MNLSKTKRVLTPLSLILIPLFGNIFSNQVNWSLFDFVIMGFLLVLFGISIHFILGRIQIKTLRIVLIIFVIVIFLMIWAELAVGVFGSLFSGS